ncbi:MAG: RebB family R body protein [Sneathiella sp.]
MTSDKTKNYSNNIADSVMAVNQIVLGSAASTAMATMYISMAHAAGVGAQNSVSTQNHLNIIGTAALAAGTGNILWEGINRQISNMPLKDRIKNYEQMQKAIAGNAQADDGEPDDPKNKDADPEPRAEGETS